MKAFKRTLKRIIALSLVLMLAITFVIPTMAADLARGSITIENRPNLPSMVDGQFTAYQVFSGTLVKEDEIPEGSTFADFQDHVLGNIDWGNGIKPAMLLDEIMKADKAETEVVDGETIPNVLKGAFPTVTKDTTAARLAEILSGTEDPAEPGMSRRGSEFMQAFARLVYKCIEKDNGRVSKAVQGTTDADDTSVIDIGEDYGYYLVVEKNVYGSGEGSTENAVISEFILDVFGPRSIPKKADVPTVDKKIIDSHEEEKGKDTDTAGIGDTVNFRLTADLPTHYDGYEWYYLYFNDTLSKGFDFNEGSVRVYVVDETGAEVDITGMKIHSKSLIVTDPERTEFPVATNVKNPDGSTKIVVDLGNLKSDGYKAIFDDKTHPAIDSDTNIVVEYSATLNEDAVVGNTGNPNDVYLAYSNDPNDESNFGVTPPDEVKVFTFELDLLKVSAEDGENNKALAGAKFYLTKSANGKVYFASVGADNKIEKWIPQETTNVAPDGATLITTDSTGHLLVGGLDAEVEYTMIEAVAPEGYNKIDPFTFKITNVTTDPTGFTHADVVLVGTNQHIKGIKVTVSGEGDKPTGRIEITAADPKAPELPFTGGMGTYLFYALGGTLFVGSSSYLIFRKKSGKNEDEE